MKRIIISLLLLIHFLASSQTEIWGIHNNAGDFNNGVLYTIDSASSKIMIRHRFSGSTGYTNYMQPYYDSIEKYYLCASNNMLYKYNAITDDYQFKFTDIEAYGNPIKMANGFLYVLEEDGIAKINPQSLEVEKRIGYTYYDILDGDTISSYTLHKYDEEDANLTQVDDRYCIWAQDAFINSNYSSNKSFILLLDTQLDSIIALNHFDDSYQLNSNMPFYNGKYYLSARGHDAIYSYNMETNLLELEIDIPLSDWTAKSNSTSNLFKGPNNIIYGTISEFNGDREFLFSYNLNSQKIDSIGQFPFYSRSMQTGVFNDQNDMFALLHTTNTDNEIHFSNITKYNATNNRLESVYNFDTLSNYGNYYCSSCISSPINFIGDRIIGTIKTTNDKHILYSYDLTENKLDSLFVLPETLPENNPDIYKGWYFSDVAEFFQVPHSNLLSFEITHNYLTDSSFIILHEYNPLTNRSNISQSYSFYTTDNLRPQYILQLEEYNFLLSDYNGTYYYKYNYLSNTLDSLTQMPKARWKNESDSTLIGIGSILNVDTTYIYRYHNKYNRLDTLIGMPEIHNLYDIEPINSNQFYIKIRLNASTKIAHVNINTGEVNIFIDRNSFDENNPHYIDDFKYLNPDYLLLTLNNSDRRFLMLYHIESATFTYLIGIDMDEDSDDENHFFNLLSVETYENNGNIYLVNQDDENGESGALYKINLQSKTLHKIEQFEPNHIDWDYFTNFGFLKKFEKTPMNYWTGEINSDWHLDSNWSENRIPTLNTNAYIFGNAKNHPIIDSAAQCDFLLMSSLSQLNIAPNGSLTVNKYENYGEIKLNANDTSRASFINSEIIQEPGKHSYQLNSSETINEILGNPIASKTFKHSPNYHFFEFSANDSLWYPIALYPFTPSNDQVFQYTTGDSIFEFIGEFKDQDQKLSIPQLNQANLYPIPNPYPSSINWNKTNLSSLTHKAFYFFNEKDSSFSAYIDGLGNHAPLIRPLDAFWVWTDGEESIQLDQSCKVHENEFEEEPINKTYLKLEVSGSKGKDETVIGFNEQASFEFDAQYDAFKFIRSTNHGPHIFTKAEEELISINQIPDTSMMDLFVLGGEKETFTIQLNEMNNIDFLVLEDLIWNTRTDLLSESYSFDYFKSDGQYPFKLYFKPWALEPIEEADIHMYFYLDKLVVNSRKPVAYAEITFYDLVGRAVLDMKEQDFFHLEKQVDIPAGHYIVQLRSGDLVMNLKIFVN